ncbi:MAG: vWA domain-containing protein [Vibrio sp.]
MLELTWWWMLLALPLPWLFYKLMPPATPKQAIHLPHLPQGEKITAKNHRSLKVLTIITWILLVIACARPVWFGEPVEYQPEHRDMMLVVDLSGSMAQEDIETESGFIDRLTAVKQVLRHFIDQRQGDRLGLVLFADHAYLQTPLTLDRQTVRQQLERAQLNMIGQRTAIGEGLGIASKTFIESDAPQRVIVLLSDGSNTAGVIEPLDAAKIAKDNNVTIYTVGIAAGKMQINGLLGSRVVDTARDLDTDTLTQIAQMTGGQYFRARDKSDLEKIYQTINELQPVSNDTIRWRPQTEWFIYPLALALLLSVIIVLLRRRHG